MSVAYLHAYLFTVFRESDFGDLRLIRSVMLRARSHSRLVEKLVTERIPYIAGTKARVDRPHRRSSSLLPDIPDVGLDLPLILLVQGKADKHR